VQLEGMLVKEHHLFAATFSIEMGAVKFEYLICMPVEVFKFFLISSDGGM
jgi:hypothetical protein